VLSLSLWQFTAILDGTAVAFRSGYSTLEKKRFHLERGSAPSRSGM
jgi:hypothetical protein